MRKIEIMNTTRWRQMHSIAYTPEEKLAISKLLLSELKVDRIEIASARVSLGEKKGVQLIVEWAKKLGHLDKLEILTFVDHNKSIDWANEAGVKRINLLTKGSLKHCEEQLRKTPEEHTSDIENHHYGNKQRT